jgi:hypothetical protein
MYAVIFYGFTFSMWIALMIETLQGRRYKLIDELPWGEKFVSVTKAIWKKLLLRKTFKIAAIPIVIIVLAASVWLVIELTWAGDYFPDSSLKRAIRSELTWPPSLNKIDNLSLGYTSPEITDLLGIQMCINLNTLNLHLPKISYISPLTPLTNLTTLGIYSNEKIHDISPLSHLTNLTTLTIGYTQISDISPLSSLTNLTEVNLFDNQISDISPLSSLTNLTSLNLMVNQISDVSPLSSLTNLTTLKLGDNRISDISPLLSLTNLEILGLDDNYLDTSTGSVNKMIIDQLEENGVRVTYKYQRTP